MDLSRNQKISLIGQLSDQFPEMINEIIISSETECAKDSGFKSLKEDERIARVIEKIFSADSFLDHNTALFIEANKYLKRLNLDFIEALIAETTEIINKGSKLIHEGKSSDTIAIRELISESISLFDKCSSALLKTELEEKEHINFIRKLKLIDQANIIKLTGLLESSLDQIRSSKQIIAVHYHDLTEKTVKLENTIMDRDEEINKNNFFAEVETLDQEIEKALTVQRNIFNEINSLTEHSPEQIAAEWVDLIDRFAVILRSFTILNDFRIGLQNNHYDNPVTDSFRSKAEELIRNFHGFGEKIAVSFEESLKRKGLHVVEKRGKIMKKTFTTKGINETDPEAAAILNFMIETLFKE